MKKYLKLRKPLKMAELGKIQLKRLREDIVLNSIFISDYRNRYMIDEKIVCDFFDGYMSFLGELEEEKYGKENKLPIEQFFDEFDTIDNLVEWYYCHEEFGDE